MLSRRLVGEGEEEGRSRPWMRVLLIEALVVVLLRRALARELEAQSFRPEG